MTISTPILATLAGLLRCSEKAELIYEFFFVLYRALHLLKLEQR